MFDFCETRIFGKLSWQAEQQAAFDNLKNLMVGAPVLPHPSLDKTAEFVLDTDAGFGAALLARINRFKIRVEAETSLAEAVAEAPSAEHERRRIGAGWPRMGSEIEPGSTIPATTGVVVLTVNFEKGCYPGQELVERMDSRGADAPRSLRVIEVNDCAAVGDSLHGADGSNVGTVTSVADDDGVALAYIKRGVDLGRTPAHFA